MYIGSIYMKLKLTDKKIKGGMKFPISREAKICKKKSSGIDCALNVIDTLTAGDFSERWRLRVNKYYPKAFHPFTGMRPSLTIEVLKELLPDQLKGKKIFFRTIKVPDGQTVLDIILEYWSHIQSKPATTLNDYEGLILNFLNDRGGHIVVLAQLEGVPHIIDQQIEESPMELRSYYDKYAEKEHWKSIRIIEDLEYHDTLGKIIGTRELHDFVMGREPSEAAYHQDDDINLKDEETGDTALINATSEEDEKYVRIFLTEYTADPNIRNNDGMTALATACMNSYENISNILLAGGADANIPDNYNITPLHWACNNDNHSIVNMLLEAGANINIRDNDGKTPLSWASYIGNKDIVKILVKAGADMDLQDNDGKTPLHLACMRTKIGVVKILVEKGANIDIQDNDGKTPLHLACMSGKKSIVKILVEKGANIDIRDYHGQTPLEIAEDYENEGIIKILEPPTASKGGRTKKGRRTKTQRKTKKK